MTKTCQRCNNDLGSRVEPALSDWLDGRASATVEVPGTPGRRRAGSLLVRHAEDGTAFALLGAGRTDPAIGPAMRTATDFELGTTWPGDASIRIAALKHVWLAACLFLGCVPAGQDADQVRAELVDARDTPSKEPLVLGPRARRLHLAKTFATPPPDAPSLLLARRLEASPDDPTWGVILAGSVFVSWPLDVDPAPLREVAVLARPTVETAAAP